MYVLKKLAFLYGKAGMLDYRYDRNLILTLFNKLWAAVWKTSRVDYSYAKAHPLEANFGNKEQPNWLDQRYFLSHVFLQELSAACT